MEIPREVLEVVEKLKKMVLKPTLLGAALGIF
jgi:hypothetical protein